MAPTVPKPFSVSNKPLIPPLTMTLDQEHLLAMSSDAKIQPMRSKKKKPQKTCVFECGCVIQRDKDFLWEQCQFFCASSDHLKEMR